ncbi:MAG: hypothetical protein KDH09_03985 [Chrysiogenetes bacterium]|nr:hypothetical protein [Chrysiogenetes bacterium]
MDLSRDNTIFWRRALWGCLGLYCFYGIWRSATVDIPIQGLEGMIVYYRMASMWDAASLSKLLSMPWWLIATGIMPLYFFCIPFFALFGINLLALQLASFAWNLIGLWLIYRAIDGERERFFTIGLLTFGLPVMAEMYLAASGTYTEMFLPFGIVLYVQHYFLKNAETISLRRAAALSGVIAIVTAFMPTMFPGVLAMCILTAVGLWRRGQRRLMLPLIAGGAIGSAIMLPMLLAQIYPSEAVFHDLPATPPKLLHLLWYGFPNFLEIRGIPYSGYPLAAICYYLIYRGFRSRAFGEFPKWSSLLFASVVFLLWLPMNSHFELGVRPDSDIIRFRQLSSAWPFWAAFLAVGIEWLDNRGISRKVLQAFQGWYLVTICACVIALFGALNWKAFGVTAKIRLDSIAGRSTDEVLPHFYAPGKYSKISKAPDEYQRTLVMLSPMSQIVTADMGDFRGQILGQVGDIPPVYHEAYWVGLGLVVCEGSMRNGPLAERLLPDIIDQAPRREQGWIRRGCDVGTRWRNGEIYLTELGWPLEPRIIETGVARLWGDTLRYRSRK